MPKPSFPAKALSSVMTTRRRQRFLADCPDAPLSIHPARESGIHYSGPYLWTTKTIGNLQKSLHADVPGPQACVTKAPTTCAQLLPCAKFVSLNKDRASASPTDKSRKERRPPTSHFRKGPSPFLYQASCRSSLHGPMQTLLHVSRKLRGSLDFFGPGLGQCP